MIDPSIMSRALLWMEDPYFDTHTRKQVEELLKHPEQLTDAFFTDLSFGTGGLRGMMGVGTNRMNIYTVRRATQGLANYILKKGNRLKGVVVGFDSRLQSEEFALQTARVLAGNKISVYLLKHLRPTPFVSFASRFFLAQAGVMITASHNPKEYNGYKVYWEDGAQVVAPHDTGIMQEIESIESFESIQFSKPNDPLIEYMDASGDEAYFDAIASLQLFPKKGRNLKISYTSLHGTGITLMPKALHRWGFSDLSFVQSQIVPDGNFPTVHFPNPEYPEALQAGIETLTQTQSDILIATDPDADRLGVVVSHEKKPFTFTGNELAALAAFFLCDTLKKQNKMPQRAAIVTTIVTTDILKKIADHYGVSCFEVLTGFKYIGQKIHAWEQEKEGYNFLFGAEESYGYLYGTHARDKDGIVSGCLFAEIASTLKESGKTLVHLLHEIYKKFGVYRERQFSQTFEDSKEGFDQIHRLMKKLRSHSPSQIGTRKVISVTDLETQADSPLPSADVLIFRLDDHSKIIIRPSGTEPKIKAYLSTHEPTVDSVEEGFTLCNKRLDVLNTAVKEIFKT